MKRKEYAAAADKSEPSASKRPRLDKEHENEQLKEGQSIEAVTLRKSNCGIPVDVTVSVVIEPFHCFFIKINKQLFSPISTQTKKIRRQKRWRL